MFLDFILAIVLLGYNLTFVQAAQVEITSRNVAKFPELLYRANPRTVFVLKTTVELRSTARVSSDRIIIRGSSSESAAVVRCGGDTETAFIVRSSYVKFANLVIRDCRGTSVSATSVKESDDPFEQQLRAEPTRLKVEFRDVAFLNNSNGAMFIGRGVVAGIHNCRFEGNSASDGGAIRSLGIELKITDSIFKDNTATESGGAIHGRAHFADRHNQKLWRRLAIFNTQFLNNRNRVKIRSKDRKNKAIKSAPIIEARQYFKFPRPLSSGGALSLAHFSSVSIADSKFDGNSAVPAGGAIHLLDNRKTNIRNCSFTNNILRSVANGRNNMIDLRVGGAIYVEFFDVSSRLNISLSHFWNNRAVHGGAVHVHAPENAIIYLEKNTFERNKARLGGGAIVLRSIRSPEIMQCTFVQNSAHLGGALFVTNGAGFTTSAPNSFRRSSFKNNTAYDGGAVYGIGFSQIKILSARFSWNRAQHRGGAVCLLQSADEGEVKFSDFRMRNNSAKKGGAIFLENIERVRFTVGVTNRSSDRPAGANKVVYRNKFLGNQAVAGGAIFYRPTNSDRNIFSAKRCLFLNNNVQLNLSKLYDEEHKYSRSTRNATSGIEKQKLLKARTEDLTDQSFLDPMGIEPCYPGGGGAVCFVLNEVSQELPVHIELAESWFAENSALVGGGLFLSTNKKVKWTSRFASNNPSTSILLPANSTRTLRLRNLTFINNFARLAGGGIFASNLDQVYYSAATDEKEVVDDPYTQLSNSPYRFNIKSNSVGEGGYGDNIATMAAYLKVKMPIADQETGFLISNQSSGQSNPLPTISLEVLDQMEQVVSAGIPDSELRVRVKSKTFENGQSIASGQIDVTAKSGILNFSALVVLAPAGTYTLKFLPQRQSIRKIIGKVEIRYCGLGEVNKSASFLCEICEFEFFSFNSKEDSCNPCPSHARCMGGAALVPSPKYWHSSPFSTIMHECLHREACSYKNRTRTLEKQHNEGRKAFLHRFKVSEGVPVFTNEEYSQCAEGYEGPLCGSCADGYGRTSTKVCKKCVSKSSTASVVVMLAFWQLILLSITLRSALVSIKDMNQMLIFIEQSANTGVVSSAVTFRRGESAGSRQVIRLDTILRNPDAVELSLEQLDEVYNQKREQIAGQSSRSTNSAAEEQNPSIECIIAIQYVSETIKIFVNYFQMTSAAININVEWTKTVRNMLATMNTIAGFSNGASFTPMTCLWNTSSENSSIFGAVFRVGFILGVMMLLMIYFFLQWSFMMRRPNCTHAHCAAYLRSRIIICFLVVIFFAYQSISEELMAIVSCIELDSKEINDNTLYPKYSIARDKYWTQDTNIECLEKKHALLVGIIGIPGIIFILFGVPLYLLFFLLYRRSKDQLMDLDVINTYGFIYQNYLERFVFWEVCILARKALIGVIVVFAYPLGSNLQGVMALGVLILALAIHLTAAPFKYTLLNVLEGCSLLVSIFTFYAGVVFNDENTSQVARVLLTTLLVLINLSLVAVFLATVFIYGDKCVTARLQCLEVADIPKNCICRLIKLASVVSAQARMNLTNTLYAKLQGAKIRSTRNPSVHGTRSSRNLDSAFSRSYVQLETIGHNALFGQEGIDHSRNVLELS
eukprot:g5921.t1